MTLGFRATALGVTLLLVGGCGGGSDGSPASVPSDDVMAITPPSGDAAEVAPAAGEPGLPIVIDNGFYMSARRSFGEGGELTSSVEFEFDAAGRQLQSITRSTNPRGDISRTDDTMSLDDEGRLTRQVSVTSTEGTDRAPFEGTIDYRFDEQGRLLLTIWTRGRRDRELRTTTELFTWDGARLLERSSRPGASGGNEVTYEYANAGFRPSGARDTIWFDTFLEPGDPGFDPVRGGTSQLAVVESVETRAFTWSADGRLLEIRRTGLSPDTNEMLEFVSTYEYDANGNPVRLTTADVDGRVTEIVEFDWSPADDPVFNGALRSLRFYP